MNPGRNVIPNFFIPGAPKAGSSTLHHYLSRHPDIYMGTAKEPNGFFMHWDPSLEPIHRHYPNHSGQKAVGDATIAYMAEDSVPPRIASVVPEAKFIWVLRDPVRRAYSHYWWRVYGGSEKRPFGEVLSGNEEYPIVYSRYAMALKRFGDHFPKESMRIVVTESISADFHDIFRGLFEFLGVDPDVRVRDDGPRNTGKKRRSRTIWKALDWTRETSFVRRMTPEFLKQGGRHLLGSLKNWNTVDFRPPPMEENHRAILEERLAEEIAGVESFLGHPIPRWHHREER